MWTAKTSAAVERVYAGRLGENDGGLDGVWRELIEKMVLTPQMTGDVVTLDALDPAALPATSQAQIVGAFPADVLIAEMIVKGVGRWSVVIAPLPFALDLVVLSLRHGEARLEVDGVRDGHSCVMHHFRGDRLDGGSGCRPGVGRAGLVGRLLVDRGRVQIGRWQRRVRHRTVGVEERGVCLSVK